MPKAITVYANEPQAGLVGGPHLKTKQPSRSATVVIAVVGHYNDSETGLYQLPLIDNNKYHDEFLVLLSTENRPARSHHSNNHLESDEQREKRKETENRLLGLRHSRYCNRYMNILRDWNTSRLYRNADHFCATVGNCSHGPAPSTFPGTRGWSFASGARSFDAANITEPRCSDGMHRNLAPDVTDADRALDALGEMLRTAVAAGLTGLEAAVSAPDTTALEPHDAELVEIQVLTSRVFERVIGWVEEGWVDRDKLDVLWRPFGTTRNFGVVGAPNTPSFMYCDEE